MGNHRLSDRIKRAADVVLGGTVLLVLLPFMAMIAAGVRLTMGSPILFRQHRPGKAGRPFVMYKFRTMRDATDVRGRMLTDAERITAFGAWLRALSLDELPELFNVLRGDMSLVGPRPLLMDYLPLYSAEQARRHDIRPGITGWAQVNGRNALSWPERFALDVWYVEHRNLFLDLQILWMTVARVIRKEGINQPGEATMSKYQGESRS